GCAAPRRSPGTTAGSTTRSCARWPSRWRRTATASTCSGCSSTGRSPDPGRMMKVVETDLPGCVVLEPQVFGDERGFFYESFNRDKLVAIGLPPHFVQGNVSRSATLT